MTTATDAEQLLALTKKVGAKNTMARKDERKAARTRRKTALLATALRRLGVDCLQPAEQHPLNVRIDQWSFIKDGCRYWAAELIRNKKKVERGRPSGYTIDRERYVATKDLVPVPMGPLADATRQPCTKCKGAAYEVVWRHEEDSDESFGARIHNKKFLLCPKCSTLTAQNNNTCDVCK